MRILVFVDIATGSYIQYDHGRSTYFVRHQDGSPIAEFVDGRAEKVGKARRIARKWWSENSAKHLQPKPNQGAMK